jgi:hypothetical protein
MVGRLAVLEALAMAIVHGSLCAALQTRPAVPDETGGGQGRNQVLIPGEGVLDWFV